MFPFTIIDILGTHGFAVLLLYYDQLQYDGGGTSCYARGDNRYGRCQTAITLMMVLRVVVAAARSGNDYDKLRARGIAAAI